MDRLEVVAAAIVDDLHHPTVLLTARRTEPPALAGGWEFPGGKVDPGESLAEALHREIREELGVEIRTGPDVPGPDDGWWWLGERYRMRIWLAVVTRGVPRPVEGGHDELRWLGGTELYAVGWLPADLPIVQAVERLMVRSAPNP